MAEMDTVFEDLLSAIQALQSWVVFEAKYQLKSSRGEMDLINELRMIVDFLRGKKLREGSRLYYLIGDLVEIVRDALQEFECIFNVKVITGLSWSAFSLKMEYVRSWVGEAKMHMLQFGADGAEAENLGEGEDEDVVGLEKDVKLLLQKTIFNEERLFRTLSIAGMVGIGKTTLVRKVYNHADVVDRFERRAWVCVSSIFSHTEVLMKLIQQVVDRDELLRMEKMERAEMRYYLQEMLRRHLKGMRYFIVLDDLQKEMRF